MSREFESRVHTKDAKIIVKDNLHCTQMTVVPKDKGVNVVDLSKDELINLLQALAACIGHRLHNNQDF